MGDGAQSLGRSIVAVSMLGIGCGFLEVPPSSVPFTVSTQAPVRVQSATAFEGAVPVDEVSALHARDELDDARNVRRTNYPDESSGSHRQSSYELRHQAGKEQLLRELEYERTMRDMCPLVLSFDGADVVFDRNEEENAFDLGGPAPCLARDWPTANTPWLVRDLNGNGAIDGGHELFGSGTRLPDGTFAKNGFAALAQLDDNRDGWITPLDYAYDSLRVWSDRNGNRRADPGELQSLRELGIVAIGLDYTVDPKCDARGNCAVEHGVFLWSPDEAEAAPRHGHVIDVHLVCQQ